MPNRRLQAINSSSLKSKKLPYRKNRIRNNYSISGKMLKVWNKRKISPRSSRKFSKKTSLMRLKKNLSKDQNSKAISVNKNQSKKLSKKVGNRLINPKSKRFR